MVCLPQVRYIQTVKYDVLFRHLPVLHIVLQAYNDKIITSMYIMHVYVIRTAITISAAYQDIPGIYT